MNKELVLNKSYGNVVVIQINRPDKLNALNTQLISVLMKKIKEAERDDTVKTIILTGMGKSFIVGADIQELKSLNSETSISFISNLHELINTIRYLDKPVISAINGYCFGAGLELAIACDLSISSDKATFGMQEVKLGIPSVIEAALLPFVIGIMRTKEFLLSGEVINSKVASDWGLVNYVVSDTNLLETAIEHARKIAENPSHSLKLQKQLINKWLENAGVDKSIQDGIDWFGKAFDYPDTKEILKKALK